MVDQREMDAWRDAETKMEPKIDETHSSATGMGGLDCTYAVLITRHAVNKRRKVHLVGQQMCSRGSRV
jgi:hypothetical protein